MGKLIEEADLLKESMPTPPVCQSGKGEELAEWKPAALADKGLVIIDRTVRCSRNPPGRPRPYKIAVTNLRRFDIPPRTSP
jgi:hypothetical protein